MILIYQIGAVRFRGVSSNVANLEVDTSRNFKVSAVQSDRIPSVRFGGYRQMPEPMKMSIKGTLIDRDGLTPNDQVNQLMSYGGRPYVDVIAYVESEHDSSVLWMTTLASVEGVDRSTQIDDASVLPIHGLQVSVDMTADAYWRAINPYLWEADYSGAGADSFRVISGPYKSTMPKTAHDESLYTFWKKRYDNMFSLYNPAFWNDMYPYPYGEASSYEAADGLSYRVRPPRQQWSGPPESKYGFTNLPTSGTLNISVESEVTPFSTDTYEASVDLAQLNTDLAPFGLLYSDILIVSDGLYAPGFVLRDGSPIQVSNRVVVPSWDYATAFPGELLGVDNQVTISAPVGVLMARLHGYRSL